MSRQQRAAAGMREDHRPRRRIERIKRRAIAAVRQVHRHADSIHPRHDVVPEHGQAAVICLEKPRADAVLIVVRELRKTLSEREEGVDVVRRAEMIGVLERDHDPDLPCLLRRLEVRRVADPHEPVGITGNEAVPVSEESNSGGVIRRTVPERDHVVSRCAIRLEIGGRHRLCLRQPQRTLWR